MVARDEAGEASLDVINAPLEQTYRVGDDHGTRLFVALCRNRGLQPYRHRRDHAGSGNAAGDVDARTLANIIKVLAPRWFVLRNVHQTPGTVLLQSRTTLCWLKGPMTRGDLKRLAANMANGA